MSQENIKKFAEHHRINIVDDNKRAHKHTRMNVKYFQNPYDYNELTTTEVMRYETVKLYTIEIAENELERMADFEIVKYHPVSLAHESWVNEILLPNLSI